MWKNACQTNQTIVWSIYEIITTNRRYHQRICLEARHKNLRPWPAVKTSYSGKRLLCSICKRSLSCNPFPSSLPLTHPLGCKLFLSRTSLDLNFQMAAKRPAKGQNERVTTKTTVAMRAILPTLLCTVIMVVFCLTPIYTTLMTINAHILVIVGSLALFAFQLFQGASALLCCSSYLL